MLDTIMRKLGQGGRALLTGDAATLQLREDARPADQACKRPPRLVDYRTVNDEAQPAVLYSYVLAGNGLFIEAQRSGLKVVIPHTETHVRGLRALYPHIKLEMPRVPRSALRAILEGFRDAHDHGGTVERPVEALCYLIWRDGEWHLYWPRQRRSAGSVSPEDDEVAAGTPYADALIEVHSHHGMPAFFSGTDNRDEQGFRIYAVMGHIFGTPQLRVRVGVYGHFWTLQAADVFRMPTGVVDVNGPVLLMGEYAEVQL